MTEMIEEEQYANADTNRISDFQDGEMSGRLSGDLSINIGKKTSYVNVVIKSHNRETCSEKSRKSYEKNFYPFPQKTRAGLIFECYDEIGFSDGADLQIRLFLLDLCDKIHDREYIAPRFVRGQIDNRHYPEAVQNFAVAAGKSCDILQINMRVFDLDILIQKHIKSVAHRICPFIKFTLSFWV